MIDDMVASKYVNSFGYSSSLTCKVSKSVASTLSFQLLMYITNLFPLSFHGTPVTILNDLKLMEIIIISTYSFYDM